MRKRLENNTVKEKSVELPKVNYLWVGPPKIDLSGENKLGSDVEDVIDVSRRATNTICYYCLDEHVQHYHDLFQKNGCHVEVKSIDKYIANMQKHENLYIREKADKMVEVRKELLTEPRNRIIDKVTFKDAFALFLLATEGGYTLDAGIKLAEGITHFTFPEEDNFKAPVAAEYECWMLYASPHKLYQSRIILDSYLSRWDHAQKIIREKVSDIDRISRFHGQITFLMIDSIKCGLKSIQNNHLDKWRFQFDKTNTSLAKVSGFPIIKIYRNTHKPYVEIKEILLKNITEYLKQPHCNQKNRNKLVANVAKELDTLRNTGLDNYRKMMELNSKLHKVFEALEEIDMCAEKLPKDNVKIDYHTNKAYLQLNNFLQGKAKSPVENPQLIIDNFRKKISKISPEIKTQLDSILLAKAHEDLASRRVEAIDHTDERGMTLIHLNVLSGKPEMVTALLQRNANPNIQDNEGKTALHHAVISGRRDLVVALLPKKRGANPNIADNNGMAPLHHAVQLKQHNIVNSLLKRHALPDMPDKQGLTPLHHAINSGDIKLVNVIINALIKKGLSLDAPDKNGITPLAYAVQKGSLEMIETLLKNGANPNVEEQNNLTLFHNAVKSNHIGLIQPLIAFGANPNNPGKGMSPLLYAVFFGTDDSVKALLDVGADPNIPNKDNNKTALHFAVCRGKKEVVELLLSKGAKTDIVDTSNKTPLDYANARGFTEIAEVLTRFQEEQKTAIPVVPEPVKSQDQITVVQSQLGLFDHSREKASPTVVTEKVSMDIF
ncbi:TPA: ankyrin repeat domain-containing protein [Legionella anisa]